MSWKERVESDIIITTGDGKIYTPMYKISPLSDSFNIAEFNFPNIPGTKIDRREIKGSKYTVDLYFQGENHLEEVASFRESSKDKRPWIVSHPMHGTLTMHPASIRYDPSGLNVTKVTVSLLETITEDNPKITVGPTEQASRFIIQATETSDEAFANQVVATSSDSNLLTNNLSDIYDETSTQVTLNDQANEYFNLFNDANNKIINVISEPLFAINAVKNTIMYPSLFSISVKARLTILSDQFTGLYSAIATLITPNEKKIFENNASSLVSGMLQTVLNPLDELDFENTTDVLSAITTLTDTYDTYILGLDSLQTDNGGDETSFIPDFDLNLALYNAIYYTVSQLFVIALSAKQERIEYISNDSNLISLTHRFLGLEPNDSTIDQFIRINKIGLNEFLQIKKGREIKYYV